MAVAEQTALALADSNISVTLLCPALVRTAMSVVGDDPDDVVRIALTALRSGRFLVAPEEWSNAIAERGSRLVGGGLPWSPSPQ